MNRKAPTPPPFARMFHLEARLRRMHTEARAMLRFCKTDLRSPKACAALKTAVKALKEANRVIWES